MLTMRPMSCTRSAMPRETYVSTLSWRNHMKRMATHVSAGRIDSTLAYTLGRVQLASGSSAEAIAVSRSHSQLRAPLLGTFVLPSAVCAVSRTLLPAAGRMPADAGRLIVT